MNSFKNLNKTHILHSFYHNKNNRPIILMNNKKMSPHQQKQWKNKKKKQKKMNNKKRNIFPNKSNRIFRKFLVLYLHQTLHLRC